MAWAVLCAVLTVGSLAAIPLRTVVPAAVAAALLGILSRESILSNGLTLHAVDIDNQAELRASATGVAVAMSVFCAATAGTWSHGNLAGAGRTLGVTAAVAAAALALSGLAGAMLARDRGTPDLTDQPAWMNLTLDHVLYFVVALVAIGGTSVFAGYSYLTPGLSSTLRVTWGAALITAISAAFWLLANNQRHVSDMAQSPRPPAVVVSANVQGVSERFVDALRLTALSTHVGVQAIASLCLLMVGCVWLLLGGL
ncbi:MAG: hypothetical protein LC797_21760 [Chloroflexi bacterium]|nr:hypothetical protein [Chloroflexota bacterium]